jgi:hypothetical protein
MNELHDLLDRATDRVGSPDLAGRALAGARRRRFVRRGVTVAAVAGVMVVVAVVGLNRPHRDSAPPVTPSPTAPTAPTRLGALTQPPWDPRDVGQLTEALPDVAPGLPDVVAPPATAPALADRPVDAAVLSIRGNDALLLLTPGGAWRSVPPPSRGTYGAVLSSDGTRLAVDTGTGVTAWTLPTGVRTSVPFPAGDPSPSDAHSWAWLDDSTLLLDDPGTGSWTVNAATGQATRVPYPGDALSWTVDSAGAVVESPDVGARAQIIDWASRPPRRVDTGASGLGIGRLASLLADAATIVGVSGSDVVVLDRGDLEPRHVLPLRDPEDTFGDGKAPVVALLADETVLVQVPVFGNEFSWRLVAWDPSSGRLTRVARGVGPVPASYASGLLG